MVTIGWMAFILFIYLGGAWFGSIYEGSTFDTTTWETLVQFEIFREQEVDLFVTSFTIPWFNTGWFSAAGDFFTWNSALWNGWAALLRMFLLGLGGVTMFGLASSLLVGRLSR